jgi:hypothetical protein
MQQRVKRAWKAAVWWVGCQVGAQHATPLLNIKLLVRLAELVPCSSDFTLLPAG